MQKVLQQRAVVAQLPGFQQKLSGPDALLGRRSLIFNCSGLVHKAHCQPQQNLMVLGILFCQGFEQRQRLQVLVLVEKLDGLLAFRFVTFVVIGLRRDMRRKNKQT